MTSKVLDALIAKGQAQFGTWTTTGAQALFKIPATKAIIITKITVKAFTDLPAGNSFSFADVVSRYSWHQLRVFGIKGRATYQLRHDLVFILNNVDGVIYTLPQGQHVLECWLPHEQQVSFELSHFPQNDIIGITGWMFNNERVPDDIVNPEPESGYGVNPTGIAIWERIYEIAYSVGGSEILAFGQYQDPAGYITAKQFFQFEWPINLQSKLNEPDFSIAFGLHTVPLVQVDYVLYNKASTATFPGNV